MRLILAVLFLWASSGHADPWSQETRQREGIVVLVTAMDWAQTRQIALHPDSYGEINPIIGQHPSPGKVQNYFISSLVLHAAVVELIEEQEWISEDVRERTQAAFQWFTVGWEVSFVAHNFSMGLTF